MEQILDLLAARADNSRWVNSNLAYVTSNSPGAAVSLGFPGAFVGSVRI